MRLSARGAKRCPTARPTTARRSGIHDARDAGGHPRSAGGGRSLHGEMVAAMRQTGFKRRFPAFLHFLRTDPQFHAKTPQDLLMRAAWIAKEFDGKATQYFGFLPRARSPSSRFPPTSRPSTPLAAAAPGFYLEYLRPADRPLYNLTALTLHESAPGHAFQIPIATRHKHASPPSARSSISRLTAKAGRSPREGSGTEMGMYDTPYDRFGMLSYQIWRAARLVVDTGIHAQGWIAQQAHRLSCATTPRCRTTRSKPSRPLHPWPGQALLLPRRTRHPRGPRQGRERWARSSTSRLPRHGAAARLGAPAGTDRRNRPLHRLRRPTRPLPQSRTIHPVVAHNSQKYAYTAHMRMKMNSTTKSLISY